MRIDLKIVDGIIEDAKFMTFGCGSAVATSSMATELIIGKSVDEALELTNKAVAEALDGLPAVKMHCSVLAEQAVKKALFQYYQDKDLLTDELREKFGNMDEDAHDHGSDDDDLPGLDNE